MDSDIETEIIWSDGPSSEYKNQFMRQLIEDFSLQYRCMPPKNHAYVGGSVLAFSFQHLKDLSNIGSSRGVSFLRSCKSLQGAIFKIPTIFNMSPKNHADKNGHNLFGLINRYLLFWMV